MIYTQSPINNISQRLCALVKAQRGRTACLRPHSWKVREGSPFLVLSCCSFGECFLTCPGWAYEAKGRGAGVCAWGIFSGGWWWGGGGLGHRIPGMLFQAGGDLTTSSAWMACKLFLALQNPVLKGKSRVDLLKENPQTKLLG